MDEEFIIKTLQLYPDFNYVYGPYISKIDGRRRIQLFNNVTKKSAVRQYAKILLEISIGRRLVGNETVDHEDNDKTNDKIDNLRILSKSVNCRIAAIGNKHSLGFKQSEKQKRSGDKNGMAVLTNEQVSEIRWKFFQRRITRNWISWKTSLDRRSVCRVLAGQSYAKAAGPLFKGKFRKRMPIAVPEEDILKYELVICKQCKARFSLQELPEDANTPRLFCSLICDRVNKNG